VFDRERLAESALTEYGFGDPVLEFIRHNENLTFKVTDRSTCKSYLLRIHTPIAGFPKGIRNSVAGIRSEIRTIEAIRQHTDILVQQPHENLRGETVTTLPIDSRAEANHCTVLGWLPGETIDDQDPELEDKAFRIGSLAARLHQFSEWWTTTTELERPTYDSVFLHGMIRRVRQGVATGLVSERHFRKLEEGAAFIGTRMEELDTRPGTRGIIHADLQKSNLVESENTIAPIDFGLSGHGYFLFDLGGLMADFGPAAVRDRILEGYNRVRSITEADLRYVEAFFVQSIIHCMGFHVQNREMHDWFERRMGPICEDYVQPLLDGKPFYQLI
jgi:Ser/Thr protein kinase RdoA (MazF antagonist)